MKKLLYLLLLLFTFSNCSDDDNQEISLLDITSYSPENGVIGDEVVITAKNINTSINYVVKINDLALDDILVTETTIKGRIPAEASSGMLEVEYNQNTISVGMFDVEKRLAVSSYTPTTGYVGDEVTFQAEGIDTTTNYIIKFDGIVASNIFINESELKGRVPTGANSGNITIEYEQFNLNVGSFDLIESTDVLYIAQYNSDSNPNPNLYKLDMASGEIIEDRGVLMYWCPDFSNSTLYNSRSNTMVYFCSYGSAQSGGGSSAQILNLETNESFGLTLHSSEPGTYTTYNVIGAIGNEALYYNEFNINNNTSKLVARRLDGTGTTILFDSSINIGYNTKRTSSFVPSLNTFIGFYENRNRQNFFFKADITNQTYTSTEINDEITEILITSEDVIYGLRKLEREVYQIVQIDPISGEVILIIDTVNYSLTNLNFSESSNRFYAGIGIQGIVRMNQIYTYSLDSEISSIMTLDGDLNFFSLMLKY